MQGTAASLLALLLGLATLPATAQTPVVEAKNADEAVVWQVNEDGGLLGLGVFETGVISAEGPGTRLMWHPAKAAFRAGAVGVFSSDGTEWDEASVGDFSVAFGGNTEASGEASTAMGGGTTAGGDASTAMGQLTSASGESSTAMGFQTTASGESSTAMGSLTTAGGDYSFAAGRRAVVHTEDHGTFAWADSEFADFPSTGTNQFLVRAAGGVGLGTNAPSSQLHVVKGINASATVGNHVAVVENNSSDKSNGPDVLALKTSATSPDGKTNFITFFGENTAVGAVEGNGSGGVVYKTSGADFAEMLPRLHASETIAPGDVVGVTGGHITMVTAGAEQVMVVTDRPALLGNDHEDNEAAHPVAFVGQVSVRVEGPVQVGDFIVPSGRADGTATALSPEAMTLSDHGQVIGRAWEAAHGEGEHRVIVAVGLDRVGALVKQIQRQQAQIETLDARLAALEQGGFPVLARFAGPVGIAALLAVLLMGGFVIRRRRSFKMPLALLVGLGAAIAWETVPAAAQTLSVQNGGTLRVAGGGVLDLVGSTLDLGSVGETAGLEETDGGRATGGVLTAARSLDAPSGVDIGGLGLLVTADQYLGAVVVTRGHVVQSGGGNTSIARYFEIERVPNGIVIDSLDLTLTLRYDDAELEGLPEEELVLFYSSDDGVTWARRGSSSRDLVANTVSLDGLPALSEAIGRWTLGAASQPLPVELTAFEARRDGSAVLLVWQTESETNNAGFEVQRWTSEDDWDVLAFVKGAGSTTDPQSYRYRIDELDVGPHRFRLRQVDFDGAATYSDEVKATVQLAEAYRIGETYPNPFAGRATLAVAVRETQPVRATLYDVLGRRVALVHDGPVEANRTVRLTIEGQNLPSGLYLLRVTGEAFATTRRLMVVR